ncbi:osmoprotectant transport system permease protein [Amycolatopsis arida]|uniref:Osmoprotectant transport system permease protein n=1 Tax=Amycolatopsis arida TaxID=587909 RepID=A0A1I5PHH7_9PSEU|nr:ABC transporter permease [Amycolatopsis arida]TDX98487.1 osmoprotectant transport system permease protein [Amycolatopsis arida]SFP32991.1 osmoprotectant transport system permease protein [Amycolatopsis arida]
MIADLWGWLSDPANWQGVDGVPWRVLQHLGYVLSALVIAVLIAVPVGLFVGHTGRGGLVLVGFGNSVRALPTLGLVTFLFLLLTDSEAAALVGLVVLAVPSVLAGTYAGVQATEDRVVDAAEGMGMTGRQRLWQVEVPIALPLVLGGVRNATLQLVATAAVAAYIGLGGLGRYVLDGLAILDYGEVAAGAVLTALLAVVLDLVFAGLQRAAVPRGVRLATAAQRPTASGGVA